MEPIAIVGMACRFPGADSPAALWKLLQDGRDAITEVPADRWNVDDYYDPVPATPGKMHTRWGGFLDQVDCFDAEFFGISAREACFMDPQQRLVLEVTWAALESAGIVPDRLAGSRTGVFIGISNFDYNRLLCRDFSTMDAYSSTGTILAIAANRLSYLLNLRGPSLAVDTACSSSLVTVHLACQSLRCRESDLALAGGVNLILSPEVTIILSQGGLLSARGRCHTFDENADGYVRSEGCGVVVLKRLSDALRDGDHIRALLRGSAVNQDGGTNGLTAPSATAQQAVIRDALANAEVAPGQISYVEAHGSGTRLGDIIEFRALKAVLLAGREPDHRCAISSIKTNIGHTEAAAGIAGLIKVVLCLENEGIPGHLHLSKLNRYIKLENTPLFVPAGLQSWPRGVQRRFAGVSSFGIGGTNAHVICEEAPLLPAPTTCDSQPPLILTLSAKSDKSLRALARRYDAFLADSTAGPLADMCFSANTSRSHFAHRLAIVGESVQELRVALLAFLAGHPAAGLAHGHVRQGMPPKLAFLFSGQDSALPMEKSALFELECSLAAMWRSWGIEPAAVAGFGVGELAAACVAGVFTLHDGLRLVKNPVSDIVYAAPKIDLVHTSERSAAMDTLRERGCQVFVEIEPGANVLGNLATLYARGCNVDWAAFYRGRPHHLRALPMYPFERKRFWFTDIDAGRTAQRAYAEVGK